MRITYAAHDAPRPRSEGGPTSALAEGLLASRPASPADGGGLASTVTYPSARPQAGSGSAPRQPRPGSPRSTTRRRSRRRCLTSESRRPAAAATATSSLSTQITMYGFGGKNGGHARCWSYFLVTVQLGVLVFFVINDIVLGRVVDKNSKNVWQTVALLTLKFALEFIDRVLVVRLAGKLRDDAANEVLPWASEFGGFHGLTHPRNVCMLLWVPLLASGLLVAFVNQIHDNTKNNAGEFVIYFSFFIILPASSVGATALLLQRECLFHEDKVREIVMAEDNLHVHVVAPDPPASMLEKLVARADAMDQSSSRWQFVLIGQMALLATSVAATIANTVYSDGGVYSAMYVLGTSWPFAISFLSILRLNAFLDGVPKTLTRKSVFTLSERSDFVADYLRLGLGFEVGGVRLTNQVVATAVVAALGSVLASLLKIVHQQWESLAGP
eukprot:COSAG06_NODE_6548_length_2886_cov_8.556512_1_plen_442_part_00